MQKVNETLAERSQEQLKDCSRVLIFDSNLSTLYSTYQVEKKAAFLNFSLIFRIVLLISCQHLWACFAFTTSTWVHHEQWIYHQKLKTDLDAWYPSLQASQSELLPLTEVFLDRDDAIRNGLIIDGTRYEACLLFCSMWSAQ